MYLNVCVCLWVISFDNVHQIKGPVQVIGLVLWIQLLENAGRLISMAK